MSANLQQELNHIIELKGRAARYVIVFTPPRQFKLKQNLNRPRLENAKFILISIPNFEANMILTSLARTVSIFV